MMRELTAEMKEVSGVSPPFQVKPGKANPWSGK
jgi:hypothetical protein